MDNIQHGQQQSFLQRFGQAIPGLLDSPQFNLGLGLLAASGQRPVGQGSGIGERLLDAAQFTNQRRAESLQLQAARDRMMQQKRQQEAQGKLRQFVSDIPEGFLAPEQQQFLGLLSDLDPAAGAQMTAGLLGFGPQQQERAEPSVIRTARALFQPGSAAGTPLNDEAQQFALEQSRKEGASADQLKSLEIGLKQLQLEQLAADRTAKQESARVERAQLESSLKKDLRGLTRLAELNDRLESTFLATGLPAAEMRRVGKSAFEGALAAAGFPRNAQLAQLDEFDEFRKLSADFLVGSTSRLEGRVTDQQMRMLQSASADLGNAPGANRAIIANAAETLLDAAEASRVSLDDEKSIRRLIQDLRAPRANTEPMKFSSEAGIDAALDAGLIQRGQIVEINGNKFRVE